MSYIIQAEDGYMVSVHGNKIHLSFEKNEAYSFRSKEAAENVAKKYFESYRVQENEA